MRKMLGLTLRLRVNLKTPNLPVCIIAYRICLEVNHISWTIAFLRIQLADRRGSVDLGDKQCKQTEGDTDEWLTH